MTRIHTVFLAIFLNLSAKIRVIRSLPQKAGVIRVPFFSTKRWQEIFQIRSKRFFTRPLLFAPHLVLAFLLTVRGAPARANPQETGSPFVTNYPATVYNAHAQNWSIKQGPGGLLYFANSNGILEYDGVSWRLIPTPKRAFIRSLGIDEAGRVYVGSVGDFGYLAPDSMGQLAYVSLLSRLKSEDRQFTDVWDTHVLNGRVYFLTDARLFRLTPAGAPAGQTDTEALPRDSLEVWTSESGFHASFVVHGHFYVREWDTGLLEMVSGFPRGDFLKLLPGGERFAQERIYVMLPYDERQILIGTRDQGLFRFDGRIFIPFPIRADAFLKENRLFLPGAVLANGTFALGTERGGAAIIDRDGALLQILNKSAGLQDETVSYLSRDREGLLWLALNNGISKIETQSPLTFFGERAGIEGSVYDIARHSGALYVATDLGVFCLKSPEPAKRSALASPPNPRFQAVKGISTQTWALLSLMVTNRDSLLLAATLDGIYEINTENAVPISSSGSAWIRALAMRRSQKIPNRVYVGHWDGLSALRYDSRNSHRWIDEGRIPDIHEEIRTIVENPDGSLWLGTNARGVLRVTFPELPALSRPRVERFGEAEGLPYGWIGVYAHHLYPLFTTDAGLFRFDETTGRFRPDSTFGVSFADGSRDVEVVVEDHLGNTWFGSEEAGEVSVVRPRAGGGYLWVRDPFSRIPRAAINAIYPERDGIVWFGGYVGLVRYDSNLQNEHAPNFQTLLRRVVVGGNRVIFHGNILPEGGKAGRTLPYSRNTLRFDFSASSFVVESENRFQTFLEGFDSDWSGWGKESWKEYTNLPPGHYRFRARSKNVYEQMGSEAVFAFTILPPWYQSWWAYAVYTVFLGLAIFAVDRIQRARLIRKERERTRIALLEVENQRKTEELEQARQLQLSMLPVVIPQPPHLEIDVFMKTATEVGGDYYDFHLSDDGVLTVVIGDATGHGLNAGTMVTATKSLFTSLVSEPDILQILQHSNRILKHLRLRGLYMGLVIVRIREYQIEICAAGMPPLLIYSAAAQTVEELVIKTLPLGGVVHFPYPKHEISLQPGDALMLMSDGFPERFNENGEIFDYQRVKSVFAEVAHCSPKEIIDHFVRIGDAWAGNCPQNDDVTFVVIKFR